MSMGRGGSDKINRNKRTQAKKDKVARQRRRTEINRQNRHKNHIRIHPNDLQALKLLK